MVNLDCQELENFFVNVVRFDWMRDEPNDWRSQDCMTFLRDQDIFGYGSYHWNDWDCTSSAGYICEKPAAY